MHPANTAEIDETLSDYHGNYITSYAFFDDVDGSIGDHEEAVLLCLSEESPMYETMQDALPSNTAPEEISAEAFYGDMYCWPDRSLVHTRRQSTKRPMPYYTSATSKALKPKDYEILEAHWTSLEHDGDAPTDEDRHGYATMFRIDYLGPWPSGKQNDCFHQIERFMCDDIHGCKILDWRADLAPHCLTEYEYGGCEGNYLWTLSCPVKRRLTLIRWHYNWCYA